MCKSAYHHHRKGPSSEITTWTERSPRTLGEWFEYGRQCFHLPDGVEAVAALKKVTRLHPGYRHADGDNPYYYLGKIYEIENRLPQAIIFYTRALAIDPLDEESLVGRGSCYTVTHQHEAAVYDFEWLLRFPKNRRQIPNKHLFLMLAENYRRMDRWGETIFWAQMAKDGDPGSERYRMIYDAMVNASDSDLYQ